jgi:UDP-N-acetylglucosamine--N-acetylmuramyl-(pentapeptide) pyrophosphoryl-undecaprenol N-acetylglucosamine transferase
MKIVLAGGGTGGHIFPLVAVVREIKKLYLQKKLEESKNVFGEARQGPGAVDELKFYYLGPADDFGQVVISQEGVETREIFVGKIRRYWNLLAFLENFLDIFIKMPLGFWQSFFQLFFLAPDLVFSKGGYGSFPVVLAAWLLRIPIFLHESDVDPGLVNKILGKAAQKIFVSFPKTEKFPPSKIKLTGNPIRQEILGVKKQEGIAGLKISGRRPIILILGGSQGAQRLNDLILAILPNLLESFEIVHQAGEKNFRQVRDEAEVTMAGKNKEFYHVFPFFREEEYRLALAAADLVVSRASSGAIFEIAAFNKPSILIPLPNSAQGHQLKNAYAFARQGAAVVLEEANATPNFFLEKLKFLFFHPSELEKMSQAARAFAKPGAAREVAQYLFNFLRGW